MRRAWAMLLCLVASGASAFVGSFPVCEPRAQYVRLEIYEGFAPADCVRLTLAEGDVRFLLATLAGFPITACVDLRGDVARIVSSTPGWKRAMSNNPHRRGTSGTYPWW